MLSKINIFILTLTLFTAAVAQDSPPTAATKSASTSDNKPKESFSWGSVKSLPISPPFVSTEGRFSIGLKQSIDGYSSLTPKQLGIKASGGQINWKFDEGDIQVSFLEFDKELMTGSENELKNITENEKAKILNSYPSAKVRYEAIFSFNNTFPASKMLFDLPNNLTVVQSIYLVGNRMYKIVAGFPKGDNEKYFLKAFDSFKIISQEDINASLKNKFESIKPISLPQEPIDKKLKSDAEDERIKGKVKQVNLEREDLSGTWSVQGRRLASETFYNKNGNLIESIFYNSKSMPSGITVWGYIDGKRVSKTESVADETGPPPMAKPKNQNDNLPKPDNRYQYSYEYKYIDGYLSEKQLIDNTGEKATLTMYKYSGNQIERLVYTSKGELNQKYFSALDEKGNVVEEVDVDLSKSQYRGNRKYRYEYEFDEQGNWIKQTTYKEETENGVKLFKPYSAYYRTIIYW